jgi:hypothetical protein
MSEKIKIKITPAVAALVAPTVDRDAKLKGLEAADGMALFDQVMLTFCLMKDRDEIVKSAASSAFSLLKEETVLSFLEQSEIHPAVLDVIAREHYHSPEIVRALHGCETLAPLTAEFLMALAQPIATGELDADSLLTEDLFAPYQEQDEDPEDPTEELFSEEPASEDAGELAEDAPTEEEYLSKYKMVQLMGISEKIKMALSGDKEWRSILVKDSNKLVSGSVIKNPRITDGEILTIIKVGVQNDEIMRLICANKEWIKNYAIRKALIENPKTPLANSLRYLATLGEKDIAAYAKSKNISSVIATQAKRLVLAKKRN